jgi:hypothetical protein
MLQGVSIFVAVLFVVLLVTQFAALGTLNGHSQVMTPHEDPYKMGGCDLRPLCTLCCCSKSESVFETGHGNKEYLCSSRAA